MEVVIRYPDGRESSAEVEGEQPHFDAIGIKPSVGELILVADGEGKHEYEVKERALRPMKSSPMRQVPIISVAKPDRNRMVTAYIQRTLSTSEAPAQPIEEE